MNRSRLVSFLLMVFILLLATYLRIYQLDTIPFGLIPDEVMRGYDAYSLWQTGADSYGKEFPLFLRGFDDYTPALYSYLSVPFVALLGLDARSIRLAAAIVGIITVAFTYQLARRPFGELAALVGAFLLAISPWHILSSRMGTEWNLLATSAFAVCFAYRGLYRSYMLVVAGAVAGILLYGYAPIKAFLPLLMIGFVIFYWRELLKVKKYSLMAFAVFIFFAIPIYIFSFTAEGVQRFSQVYEGGQSGILEAAFQLIRNYLSYFSPKFYVLSQYDDKALHLNIVHLKSVGLISWYEFVLIILGIGVAVILRKKSSWFILYWLFISAIGINLHSNSPWPTLWLTVIPVPHILAGAGFSGLLHIFAVRLPLINASNPILIRVSKMITIIILVGLGTGILMIFGRIHHDLFFEFPIYGSRDGREDAIQLLDSLKEQYDEVTVAADSLATSIYLLFYNRYEPTKRQAELAEFPDKIWQKIDDYNIGNIEDFIDRPGCHLILTSVAHSKLLRPQIPQLMPVQEYSLPSGEPSVGLYALASPLSQIIESGAVFGDQIILQGFASVPTGNSKTSLTPGKSICILLQWQALNDLTKDFTVFVHLTGPHESTNPTLQAQHDSPPLHGIKPTSTWRTGDVVQDIHRIVLPDNLSTGTYEVEVGMYDFFTGERLSVKSSEDDNKLRLFEFKVLPE